MKKRFELTYLLIGIIVGALTSASISFFSTVNATYVEGYITQDTVWTLTDSPFVVSKNVTIRPDATLTIEPRVEVRFGGDFSLNVEGSLLACGTEDEAITFTSNKDYPEAGDWNTIKFYGTEPSTLTNCVVEYAKNGITIVNGKVEVKDNEIAHNSESGIYVTGDNNVAIRNNKISSNANGILLTGGSTAGVSITENIVMSNSQSGIQLNVEHYIGAVIVNNILSANNKGFYVSGQASTYITENSISYNTIGVFYGEGKDHVAYYNDIYGNDCGMDVLSSVVFVSSNGTIMDGPSNDTTTANVTITATVNAEYNYWGHESGPYHVSLNPAGKGNPVGGNGVNLDFIFFLAAPISHINTRPIARLLKDKTLVSLNQVVTFIATTSSDDGRVDTYLFDFGDGYNSGWTTLSIFTHEYSSVGTYDASLTVMDDFGVSNTNVATETINVEELDPLVVSATPTQYIVVYGEEVSITVDVTYETSAVEDADITLFAIGGGNFTSSSGFTDSTGCFTTTYIAPNVTQIANVRITATASKNGYADGADYAYLTVLPPLSVQVTAEPALIESEATSEVTVHVSYNEQPVGDALINISSDGGGNFSATTRATDLNGTCTFVFTAPQTTAQLNINIRATATKAGYLGGQGQTKITVEPPILVIELTADSTRVYPEETSYVTVHVTHNATPISKANVTMSSEYGTISPETGTTDSKGIATFNFTAPHSVTQLNVTLTATATKAGYADGKSQAEMTVILRALHVQVTASPGEVGSKDVSSINVHVTYNGKPIEYAIVTMWSDGGGDFSATEATTDLDGTCTFVFTAPQTTAQLNINITATATKTGYIDREGETRITVNPAGGIGLSLTTLVIIAVLIVVTGIVVTLVKLKVICVSGREE